MQPENRNVKIKWRGRHPVLFWLGIILLLLAFGHAAHWAARGPLAGPRIAVVNLEGLILDASEVARWLETIRRDSSVRAVVLRVNSPGGAVAPSQELYRAVKRAAQAKPLIVSMGSVAASGGYYAALGGREIFANPSTLTAGIGVKLHLPNLEGLLRNIGIAEKTLTTGDLKDAGAFSRPPTAEEEAYFRELIGDMFEEFLATVARERNLPPEQVRALADGRAMTGKKALQAGLVDRLGDFEDAVIRAMELGGLPADAAPEMIAGPEKSLPLLRKILGVITDIPLDRGMIAGQPAFLY
ncbi:MAG: signal peptide peptidase SppA [Deltaproteobacteria bacterium]|jgi:protease-4|nr:signal peptide peptidase SppA [Deltaproteobacteria bacterium]